MRWSSQNRRTRRKARPYSDVPVITAGPPKSDKVGPGIYLGVDSTGGKRFLSSRKTANVRCGPASATVRAPSVNVATHAPPVALITSVRAGPDVGRVNRY